MLPNANTYEETPQEFHFIYLGNTGFYHILKTCYIIYILFSTTSYLFHNLIFFCSYNTHIFHHVLNLNTQPGQLMVKTNLQILTETVKWFHSKHFCLGGVYSCFLHLYLQGISIYQ